MSVNSKADATIEYQAIITSKTFKYNLLDYTFKTNLRALQGDMYIGEATVLYTCGVFSYFFHIFENTGLRKMVTKIKKVRIFFFKSAKISWNNCNNSIAVSTYHTNRKLYLYFLFV